MAVLTANDFAQQMIAQARVLDPSFSGEVGTPERVIIDTVAQELADSQVDLTGLQGALDIDSKFGTNLDRFTQLFGFQRQQAAAATGYVEFSRTTAATNVISIPATTVLQSNTASEGQTVQYTTTAGGSIAVGATTSGAIPIQAVVTGTVGNAAANTITIMVGSLVPGVTAVTNPNPLLNGTDAEDDNSLKVRFKNTWARNLAGTQDQYLALAVAGPFTTKANVIGVQSRYREYVQVPDFDDAGFVGGSQSLTEDLLGVQGQWTTALSTIPFAKQIYTTAQAFVSNGQQGPVQYFYRPDSDFTFNYPPVINGDAIRATQTTVNGAQTIAASGTLRVTSTVGFPPSGTILVLNRGTSTPLETAYSGLTTTPSPGFTGVATSCIVGNGDPVYLVPSPSVAPNFTLYNVFNPSSPSTIPGLQAVAPGDILLTEFSYVSAASRNDISRNVTNAVDLYVDGSNDVQASTVFLANVTGQVFNTNPNSPWYYENYRRDGQPTKRPQLNNYITPLFQSPVDGLPSVITINNQNFYEGFHYWLIHEVDALGGSIRARDGIEWNSNLLGDTGAFPAPTVPSLAASYLAPYFPTGGQNISASTGQAVQVTDYSYDSNVPVLQASVEKARQITTDVLVHKATIRYLKLDITVIYSPNSNFAVVNAAIGVAVQAYLDRQYFGTVIQLSTLLEIIHEVSGVDNVRWSNDLPIIPDLIRVFETDINGNPLHGASIDRWQTGPILEQQTLYIVGQPQGTFTLSWTDITNLPGGHIMTTAPIAFTHSNGTPVTASDIQTAIRAADVAIGATGIYHNITVSQDTRPTTNVSTPITSFTVVYGSSAATPVLPSITQTITASTYAFDNDFILLDHQLPSLPQATATGDTVPGLIIRPRAQSTFYRAGLG